MLIDLKGLEELLDSLELITKPEELEAAVNKGTLLLEREAKKKAPKGEIRNSIASKTEGLTGTVYTPLEYAPYVEYGTGIFSDHPMGGRKEVPWVYIEGSTSSPHKKTIHTEESAKKAVAYLESMGLDARITSGQKPQPYMRPALDENRDEILKIIGEALLKQ